MWLHLTTQREVTGRKEDGRIYMSGEYVLSPLGGSRSRRESSGEQAAAEAETETEHEVAGYCAR
jgi:hypothetical protein